MSKKISADYKRQKQRAAIRLAIAGLMSLLLLINGQFVLLSALLSALFIVNELFLADHIFYDPGGDYRYRFDAAFAVRPEWSADGSSFNPSWEKGKYDTALLAVNVQHSWLGKFLDPHIKIKSSGIERTQYLERSASGLRYINISEVIESGDPISIEPIHCQIQAGSAEVLLFSNPLLNNKKLLVIAPHADDAEIAAFGLYSSNDSSIVTITAGEVGANKYESRYTDAKQASLLKGRLRAWDSIAIPQWAGLKSDSVIQLGYFCLRLKAMHDSPKEVFVSKTSGVTDTRVFREFNEQTLASDQHGTASWNTLVIDLVECIERVKPDVIVMPHQQLDPHQDHYYSTEAVKQALSQTAHKATDVYFYANHLVSSDMFPFGPVHTLASIYPNTENYLDIGSVVSVPMSLVKQKDKAAALAMMHDLQTPLRLKKKIRFKLQEWFIARSRCLYGEDEYFRKAIRSNELFFQESVSTFLANGEKPVKTHD
ncbi:MAG: PIG-L family deacetylase [Cycloclasticus sp.]|nr:MAG: PIG-L family deacetylase [Cycloclasticus sp.]